MFYAFKLLKCRGSLCCYVLMCNCIHLFVVSYNISKSTPQIHSSSRLQFPFNTQAASPLVLLWSELGEGKMECCSWLGVLIEIDRFEWTMKKDEPEASSDWLYGMMS